MRDGRRLVLAGLAATILLAGIAGDASGNTLSISEQQYRIVWSSLEFEGTGTIRCNVTLEGSFHSRSIAKTFRSLIGNLRRVTLGACTGGSVTALSETMPWHVMYEGFAGSLPNIERVWVSIIGVSFRVFPTGLFACLLRSTTESPARGWFQRAGTSITSFSFGNEAAIPLTGEFLCPATREHIGGSGTITGGPTLTLIPARRGLTLI